MVYCYPLIIFFYTYKYISIIYKTTRLIFYYINMISSLVLDQNLNDLISEKLSYIKTSKKETKAYIKNILGNKILPENDLSKDSITLRYSKAKQNFDFKLFQTTADWIFFTKIFFPESLNNASQDYYNSIAQNSYYNCYIIINREWQLFEELSDNFIYLTQEINKSVVDLLPLSQPSQDEQLLLVL